MALGNLADLEELEPTPGRPDPLTLYHKVGTSQEGWGPLLPGDWEGAGEERSIALQSPFRVYPVHARCSQGCPRGVLVPCLGVLGPGFVPSALFLLPVAVLPGV